MSYLCLLASERAMAVVGDSRLTLSPVPLHWDKARKIGCDQGQRCLWACCGLTVFGGVNYAKLAARIFHGSGTLTEKAQALAKRVNPPLSVQRRLYRQTTTFSLLAGQWTEQGAELLTLDLDGKHTDLRRWPAPAFLEAGWEASLRPPMLSPEGYRQASSADLARLGRERVALVIAADHRLAREQKKHIQTVGGPILWATLERPEKG